MNVDGTAWHTIWWKNDGSGVGVIDQRHLPQRLVVETLGTVEEVFRAIREMHVRGAPLIGAAASCGVALAARSATDSEIDDIVARAATRLKEARPTAINLAWAVERVCTAVRTAETPAAKRDAASHESRMIIEEEIERCRLIGEHGLQLIEDVAHRKSGPVNVLTHCNAGWLACVDHGTATAPVYRAHDLGIDVHVWVDETRPRNQGARLTAWELGKHGVPHTVITDNAGGQLMQTGRVDLVLVGSDRTTRAGDVVNKIGTYLKALAAYDNGVPFYVAIPTSSIDFSVRRGVDVPIEERDPDEVHLVDGFSDGVGRAVRITPESSDAANLGFDVTPARLVTALITEHGICEASETAIGKMFPERDT